MEVDEEDKGDHGSELPDDESEDCRSSEETDYDDMPPLILKSKQGLQYVTGYIAKRVSISHGFVCIKTDSFFSQFSVEFAGEAIRARILDKSPGKEAGPGRGAVGGASSSGRPGV